METMTEKQLKTLKLIKYHNEVSWVLSEVGENTIFNLLYKHPIAGFSVVFQERPHFTEDQINRLMKIFNATSCQFSQDKWWDNDIIDGEDIIITQAFDFSFYGIPKDIS